MRASSSRVDPCSSGIFRATDKRRLTLLSPCRGGHGSSETSIKTTWHTRQARATPRVGPGRWELVSNLFGDGDQKWVGFRLLFCLLSRRSGELLYPLEFLCRPISVSRLFSSLFPFFFPSFSKGEEEEEEEKFKSGGRQEDAHMALVIPSSHGRFTLKYLYLFMMKYIIIRGRCKICIWKIFPYLLLT